MKRVAQQSQSSCTCALYPSQKEGIEDEGRPQILASIFGKTEERHYHHAPSIDVPPPASHEAHALVVILS